MNKEFLKEYKGALDAADEPVVFYSKHALKIKGLEDLSEQDIFEAFGRDDLNVFTDSSEFESFIYDKDLSSSNLLFMSSGNYGGVDFNKLSEKI